MNYKQKLRLAMNKQQLNKIQNDILIALAMIEGSISPEKKEDLKRILAEEAVIKHHSDLKYSAGTLLEFALENELYEACTALSKLIDKLDPNDR